MKYLIILFLGMFLSPIISCGQDLVVENDTAILWKKDRLLNWEDFKGKGKAPKNENILHKVAETISLIKLAYVKNKNGVEKEVFLCYFSKNESWTITEDIQTLEHEQIHFDIMEVYTRRIRKKHLELDSLGISDLNIYDAHTSRLIQESIAFNEKYDEEVLLNYPKQKEWRICIDKELEELKEYEFVIE